MKRLAYALVLLLLSGTPLLAQDDLKVWNRWCSNKDSMLLFSAAYNEINIYSHTIDLKNIILKPLDRTLKVGKVEFRKDTLAVLAMPYASGDKKMRLAIQDKKTKKTLKTITFTGTSIPAPEAHLGNLPLVQEATKKDIIAQMMLKITFPGSFYAYPYKIKQFTYGINNGKTTDSFQVTGSILPKNFVKNVFAVPTGSVLKFTGIKASCPDCGTRELEPIKITIK